MHVTRGVWLALASVFAAACSNTPVAEQRPPAASATECRPASGSIAQENATAVDEVRRAAESGPLYAALAARSPVVACRVVSQSGEVALAYSFADSGSLTVTRDPAIESSNQEARLGSPSDADGVDLMRRVERASFTPDGCGVNWEEATSSSPGSGVSEAAYYGETCNCQARIRTDAGGRVIGLLFRSAC